MRESKKTREQQAQGSAAVGEFVLYRGWEFGGGDRFAVRDEDGVVAETVGATGFAGDGAAPFAADDRLGAGVPDLEVDPRARCWLHERVVGARPGQVCGPWA